MALRSRGTGTRPTWHGRGFNGRGGPTVAVAMSGGVDSSVAAALLLEQGHRVVGLTMLLFAQDRESGCCGSRHLEDARAVCARLGIAHYALDLREAFRREVMDPFVASYVSGLTPNPCIFCNRDLKFRHLLAKARAVGADLLATGHYARRLAPRPVRRSFRGGGSLGGGGRPDLDGRFHLLRAADSSKDQSYFLFPLGQEILSRVVFPLGVMRKSEVRKKAASLDLHVHDKKESQEICFIPRGGLRDFLREHAGPVLTPGSVLDTSGKVLGRHQGIVFHTVGQRKGLGVAGREPLYVVRLDQERDVVILGTRVEASSSALSASGAVWVMGEPPGTEFEAMVQIRHRHKPAEAIVRVTGPAAFTAEFAKPQLGVAPGQAAVLYRGDEVLGGGWIDKPEPATG